MKCIYHYSIIKSIFTALKILCTLPVHPLSPEPLAITDLLTVVIVLPFPECHRVGIIQYAVFWDWLLSLCNRHLVFLHVFSWLDHFFLALNIIPLSGCSTVYLSIHLLTGILVTFKIWQLRIKLLLTSLCSFLCGHRFAVYLG